MICWVSKIYFENIKDTLYERIFDFILFIYSMSRIKYDKISYIYNISIIKF